MTLLDHINKVRALANQLVYLEIPVKNEDVMTLLERLSSSYEYLIATLETKQIMELTMKYVMARLMHEMLKR